MTGVRIKIQNIVLSVTYEDTEFNLEKLTRKLRKAHIKVKREPKLKVQNIVASVDFGRKF
ncbi:unnamed protein product, partial [marine sediment metagenome]